MPESSIVLLGAEQPEGTAKLTLVRAVEIATLPSEG